MKLTLINYVIIFSAGKYLKWIFIFIFFPKHNIIIFLFYFGALEMFLMFRI